MHTYQCWFQIGKTLIWDPFVDSSKDNLVPGQWLNFSMMKHNFYFALGSSFLIDYAGQGFDKMSDVVDKIRNGVDDKLIIFSSSWNPSDLKMMALPTCLTFAQVEVMLAKVNHCSVL